MEALRFLRRVDPIWLFGGIVVGLWPFAFLVGWLLEPR